MQEDELGFGAEFYWRQRHGAGSHVITAGSAPAGAPSPALTWGTRTLRQVEDYSLLLGT